MIFLGNQNKELHWLAENKQNTESPSEHYVKIAMQRNVVSESVHCFEVVVPKIITEMLKLSEVITGSIVVTGCLKGEMTV